MGDGGQSLGRELGGPGPEVDPQVNETAARPKAVPTGPIIGPLPSPPDKIDTGGSVTLRHNSRLHHIGLGARLGGTPVMMLIDDLPIRVFHRHSRELIRELTLDPSRDYQARGLPQGPPKRSAATDRGAVADAVRFGLSGATDHYECYDTSG